MLHLIRSSIMNGGSTPPSTVRWQPQGFLRLGSKIARVDGIPTSVISHVLASISGRTNL